ncbi:MAG: AAA family ATPase, partial [Chlamydiae bacterium]|nr:AAA family ATPase [Chlamydiota bacterium]
MKKLPLGIADYKKTIQENYSYVDKTLLIQEILELGSEVLVIPRPRRFGKTMNLSMLRYFFEKTREDHSILFHKFKIWNTNYREHQGKYPVIFFSLKEIKSNTWEEAYDDLKATIAAEFERHGYLITAKHPDPLSERKKKGALLLSQEEKKQFLSIVDGSASSAYFKRSLLFLSMILQRYYQEKVYILIDEYDAPIHTAFVGNYYKDMVGFVRSWLGSGLKDNRFLQQAILTGILRVAKESIFSGLNNLGCYTVLQTQFSDKFGLVEKEVLALCKEHKLSLSSQRIRDWYNGYKIGSHSLYNPWSILQCIAHQGKLQPYWVNTSDNASIKDLLIQSNASLKQDMELLLQGQSIAKPMDEGIVFSSLPRKEDAVWSLLLMTGYLTLVKEPEYILGQGLMGLLRIPNVEIKELYRSIVDDWFKESLSLADQQLLLKSLVTGDVKVFTDIFQSLLLSSMSFHNISHKEPEKVYHAFVLGLLVYLESSYRIQSNRESGFGLYDICLIPKNR